MDLKKLQEREAKLKQQIKDAKAAQAKKTAALHARRCRIVGAAILAGMENSDTLKQQLLPIIDARTKAPADRKALGLPPLKNVDKSKEADQSAGD